MITTQEIVNGLYGALRLAVRDRGGFGFFDASVAGFWRSFAAAFVSLPAYAVLVIAGPPLEAAQVDGTAFVLIEAIAYVIHWTAFPAAMVHLAPALGRPERLIGLLVAWNWASAVQINLIAAIAAIGAVGLLPDGLVSFVSLVAIIWILTFQWFVARAGLNVNGIAATGVVALDFCLGLLITSATQMVAG